MTKFRSIADIRREYGDLSLDEKTLLPDPFLQFQVWFEEVLQNEMADPTAMVLSTVDESGYPDSRVVLLKGLEKQHFLFYTNYQSRKAQQIRHQPHVAINFYWPQMARQVRIRGLVKPVTEAESDRYFATRPSMSQLSAIASMQSHEIPNREFLHQALNELIAKHQQQTVVRPEFWGGYALAPEEFEFWQGRDNRLHDRIRYALQEGQWQFHRLAP